MRNLAVPISVIAAAVSTAPPLIGQEQLVAGRIGRSRSRLGIRHTVIAGIRSGSPGAGEVIELADVDAITVARVSDYECLDAIVEKALGGGTDEILVAVVCSIVSTYSIIFCKASGLDAGLIPSRVMRSAV